MRRSKKKLRYMAIVLALIFLPIGAFTLGYFFKNENINAKTQANTLTVDGSLDGTFKTDETIGNLVPGDTVNKSIVLKPNCTAPSLLRVKVEPYWEGMDTDGAKDGSNITIGYSSSINFKETLDNDNDNDDGYWYKHNDGYLYFIGEITSDIKEINLVDNIKFEGDNNINNYQNKTLKMNVSMELVQSKYDAFESAWNIPGENLKNKLKSITTD